jgi:hypothetical protein
VIQRSVTYWKCTDDHVPQYYPVVRSTAPREIFVNYDNQKNHVVPGENGTNAK